MTRKNESDHALGHTINGFGGSMKGAPPPRGSILSFKPTVGWTKPYDRTGLVLAHRDRADNYIWKDGTAPEWIEVLILWEDGTTAWAQVWDDRVMKRLA